MEEYFDIISFILFAVGSYFIISSAIGALRMPDFFTRLHPIGMSDSIGLPLILLGVLFKVGFGLITVKILLIIAISLLTSSTASHALSKAALNDKKVNSNSNKNK